MRYRFPVTDFLHDHSLNRLSATEMRLSAALAQPKRIALGCIAALTVFGWLAIGLMSASSPLNWQALCQPSAWGGLGELALTAPMWMAMTLAMMLPTAGPMILTYAEIADTAARKREPVVSPVVLTAGYVAVWLGFALAAAWLQWALARHGLPGGGSAGRLAGGTIFLGAGLYQFSALKQACLKLCQRPFPFFFANWTTERSGVFQLGLRQGMLCLGCCWAMMALMFTLGAMNVVWMAALGVVMTIEKLSTTPRLSKAMGFVFVAAGFGMMVSSVV
jgi:predicted metal-binding membrane protein